MWSLPIIERMLNDFVENRLPLVAADAAKIALLDSPGSAFDARSDDWSILSPFECNFKGYQQLDADQGGPDSLWLPVLDDSLKRRSQVIDVSFLYNSSMAGADTNRNASHAVLLGRATAIDPFTVVKVWELPTPRLFAVDGDVWAWRLDFWNSNAEDI